MFYPLNYNEFGASGGTRTHKILVLNQTRIPIPSQRLNFGAKDWDRTSDTRIFNPLLYHLSYIGKLFGGGMVESNSNRFRDPSVFKTVPGPAQITLQEKLVVEVGLEPTVITV